MYTRVSAEGILIAMTHVDDTLISGSDDAGRGRLIKELGDKFKLKNLGPVELVLGMEVRRTGLGPILLSQERFARETLEKFGMSDCKPAPTPAPAGVQLSVDQCPQTDAERATMATFPYRELVGHLNYLANNTRPDIAPAVSDLGRFMSNPGMAHWQLGKRILRYIKGTPGKGINFSGSRGDAPILTAYVDADFAECKDTRKSHTGFVLFINGMPVSWKGRKKQGCVATSSTHAEYIALFHAIREVVYMRQLLLELQHDQKGPTTIFEDNQGAIAIAKNPVNHARTKHIDIKFHYIREQVRLGSVKLKYIPTADQVADVLTKALGKAKFTRFRATLLGEGL